jgi:hypothetical protein
MMMTTNETAIDHDVEQDGSERDQEGIATPTMMTMIS